MSNQAIDEALPQDGAWRDQDEILNTPSGDRAAAPAAAAGLIQAGLIESRYAGAPDGSLEYRRITAGDRSAQGSPVSVSGVTTGGAR